MLPKHMVDVKAVEINRMMKCTKSDIYPISFSIPRTRMEFFQDDLYPPTLVNSKLIDV